MEEQLEKIYGDARSKMVMETFPFINPIFKNYCPGKFPGEFPTVSRVLTIRWPYYQAVLKYLQAEV